MRVIAEIHGDIAEIHPLEFAAREAVAAKLLAAAAGDRRREVRTATGHNGGGFRVPLEIAQAAGLVLDDDPAAVEEPMLATAAEPAPAKTARRTSSRGKADTGALGGGA
ncbi:hypothetical protein [Nocardia panacis]|uniref:hypothetical protein n=1 Tax=Nocardia panacis TaxID=2340916 RepID=UPI0011C417FC|nr:hypothetical protein [Nocardia panacis]